MTFLLCYKFVDTFAVWFVLTVFLMLVLFTLPGHPTLISTAKSLHPQLTLCVRFDDPIAAGDDESHLDPELS